MSEVAAAPLEAGELLWRGERANIVPTGTDGRMPLTTIPGVEAGTGNASAGRQSDENIGRSDIVRHEETRAAATASERMSPAARD
jgi:hypothetical protein